MAQKPTMKTWTNLWYKADKEAFQKIYAKNALIFPPHKAVVQGNKNILEFMKGGLGKVNVIFEPTILIVNTNIAFESGIFKDTELLSNNVLAKGNYSVSWILENSNWKILCHSWSMPKKEE